MIIVVLIVALSSERAKFQTKQKAAGIKKIYMLWWMIRVNIYCTIFELYWIYCHRYMVINLLSAGDAFKRIQTVFPQPKIDRN